MVSKREVVPQDESPSESCLHCEKLKPDAALIRK
jgi:hypothetical protein